MTARIRKHNRKPMSEEKRKARQVTMGSLEHWAQCRKCGLIIRGTLTEVRNHTCAESPIAPDAT